jgi:hypothetical protein
MSFVKCLKKSSDPILESLTPVCKEKQLSLLNYQSVTAMQLSSLV